MGIKLIENINLYKRKDGLFTLARSTESPSQDYSIGWAGEDGSLTTVPNKFKNAKFICTVSRSDSRAFLVEINSGDEKFRVELIVEVVDHLMKSSKIDNSIIYGDFVFVSDGSQTNLVEETYPPYIEALKNEVVEEELTTISKTKLTVNNIYQTRTQYKALKDKKYFEGLLYVGEFVKRIYSKTDSTPVYRKTQGFIKIVSFDNKATEISYINDFIIEGMKIYGKFEFNPKPFVKEYSLNEDTILELEHNSPNFKHYQDEKIEHLINGSHYSTSDRFISELESASYFRCKGDEYLNKEMLDCIRSRGYLV